MTNKNLLHWNNLANQFGPSFKSTTKHLEIKKIELAIIENIIRSQFGKNKIKILELGCGNGINLSYLKNIFKKNNYYGIDYSEKMISSAVKSNKNIVFTKGDITKLKSYNNFEKFDFIFTNRCLINIFSKKKINFIIDNIYKISKKNGIILFMENFKEGHSQHNYLRKILKLKKRLVAPFNRFINLKEFCKNLKSRFNLIDVVNYSSLYDLFMYVLYPSINKGIVNYNSQVTKKLAQLIINFIKNKKKIIHLNIESGQNYYVLIKKK